MARCVLRRAERRQVVAAVVHGSAPSQRAHHPGRESLRHGTEALRGAVYAVAAGACDIALAMGVEKLKDTGFGGLPERTKGTFEDLYLPSSTAPAPSPSWRAPTPASTAIRWRISSAPWPISPARAMRTRRAIQRRICATASPSSRCSMRRSFLSARRARLLRRERRRRMRHRHHARDCARSRQARCGIRSGAAARAQQRVEMGHRSWDGTHTLTTPLAARRAYAEAGLTDPRGQIDLIEVHDCFSITELVLMRISGCPTSAARLTM